MAGIGPPPSVVAITSVNQQGLNVQLPAIHPIGTQAFDAVTPIGMQGPTLELSPSDDQAADGIAFDVLRDGEAIGTGALFGIIRANLNSAWLGLELDGDDATRAEAFVLLLSIAFEELALHRVEVMVAAADDGLQEQLRGLGVPDEGIATRLLRVDGEYRDQVRFVFDAELWTQRGDSLKQQFAA